ncbi:MAG: cell division protein FtsQ/DivIB [Candidatus Puniceispirillaceae bacterium]
MRRLALPAIFAPRNTRMSVKAGLISFAGILAGVCVLAGYLKADMVRAEFHAIAVARGFTPTTIKITGRNHTGKQEIVEIVNQMKGKSILAIDLTSLRADILTLGWVEDAVIIRTLPDMLEIRLSERQPVALLQTTNGHQLVDAGGTVITGANPEDFSHLVVASGAGAAERVSLIIDILRSEPELFADVWAVQYVSQRRWDIHMRSGLTVRLPERDPVLAWSRLAKLEQETAITERDLAAIDLRVPGQLIVEPNIPIRGKGRKT